MTMPASASGRASSRRLGPASGSRSARTPARRWSPTLAFAWRATRSPRVCQCSRSPALRPCWPALCAAGLPTDRFLFAGFPPPRPTARRAFLEGLKSVRATLILFEGPSRLAASLADMASVLGPRAAVVARELTKLHETHYRGSLEALAADPGLAAPKGEIVIVIAPPETEAASEADAERALAEALLRLAPAQAAAEVARALGLDRRALYRRALSLKGAR